MGHGAKSGMAMLLAPIVMVLCIIVSCSVADEEQITSAPQPKQSPKSDYSAPAGYPAPDEFVEVSSMPELVHSVQPEYPETAKERGAQGEVWIRALVDKDGTVQDAVIQEVSDPNSGFAEAALQGAKEQRFRTAMDNNGDHVAIWVSYKVAFVLSDDET